MLMQCEKKGEQNMTVLIDTNLAIDVLLKREPFFENAQLILLASEQKYISGFISASSITDIFYIVNKHLKDKVMTRKLVKDHLIKTISIAAVNSNTILEALDAEWDDFEDCVQYMAGKNISADYIITRNAADYNDSKISVVTPEELLDIIAID